MKQTIPIILSILLLIALYLKYQQWQSIQHIPELEKAVYENAREQWRGLEGKNYEIKEFIRFASKHTSPLASDQYSFFRDSVIPIIPSLDTLIDAHLRPDQAWYEWDAKVCEIINSKSKEQYFRPRKKWPKQAVLAQSEIMFKVDRMIGNLKQEIEEARPAQIDYDARTRPFLLQTRSQDDSARVILLWGLPYEKLTYEIEHDKGTIEPLFPNTPDGYPIAHQKITIPLESPNEVLKFRVNSYQETPWGRMAKYPVILIDSLHTTAFFN